MPSVPARDSEAIGGRGLPGNRRLNIFSIQTHLNPLEESRLSRYLDPSSEKDNYSRIVKTPVCFTESPPLI